MGTKHIITVARQFGSGGREIAQALAKELGIDFYDKELISMAAKESGMSPEVFEKIDEQATNSLLYSLSMGLYNFGNGFSAMGDLPVNDKLYIIQHKMIKKLADKGPCVILGRCADYILRDFKNVFNVFVTADMDDRIKAVAERKGCPAEVARKIIMDGESRRSSYYNFYTGKRWGYSESYDLCINTSRLGIDGTSQFIIQYIEKIIGK